MAVIKRLLNWIHRLIEWAKRPGNPNLWPEKATLVNTAPGAPEGRVFHWYSNPPGLIRRLLNWIRRFFKRGSPVSPVSPGFRPWMRHDKPELRYVEHRSVSSNSPKRQPCPGCGKRVRRFMRSPELAKYECKKCEIVIFLKLKQKRRRPDYRVNRKRRRWHLGRRQAA